MWYYILNHKRPYHSESMPQTNGDINTVRLWSSAASTKKVLVPAFVMPLQACTYFARYCPSPAPAASAAASTLGAWVVVWGICPLTCRLAHVEQGSGFLVVGFSDQRFHLLHCVLDRYITCAQGLGVYIVFFKWNYYYYYYYYLLTALLPPHGVWN